MNPGNTPHTPDMKEVQGFTLVEIMVTLVVGSIVMLNLFKIFTASEQTYIAQEQVTEIQQSLRYTRYILAYDIGKAGFDPRESGLFGFVNSFPVSSNGESTSVDSSIAGSIAFTADLMDTDGDGNFDVAADPNKTVDSNFDELIAYRLNNSILQRFSLTGWQTVAENIEALSFAYAYDIDNDGILETSLTNGYTIWAQDVDNDGKWDNIDSNDDGLIESTGDPDLAHIDTGHAINLADIRAVKFWILTKGQGVRIGYTDTNTYKIGSQVKTYPDTTQRRLLTGTVYCRNIGQN